MAKDGVRLEDEVTTERGDGEMTKLLQILVTLVFLVGGVVLLCVPVRAQDFTPVRFTVLDTGKVGAPDVVLIPGLASSRSVWDAEAKLLAPNFRLHLVQVNGFGSQAAGANATGTALLPGIVEELHTYLVVGKMHPVVVGHSLGGLLTLMLAAKYPGDVRKIVIVDALPFYSVLFSPSATVETVRPQAEAMKQQILGIPDAQYNAMQPMMMKMMVKDPEGLKVVVADTVASDRKVMVEAMIEDMETDMRPAVATIKVPALVLYEHDATLQMPNVDTYEAAMKAGYQAMPNVTLVRMDGARHFIMYDQPAKFDSALQGFLK
jgi:pimeloyl-ACP methyl ester carboxylesterase